MLIVRILQPANTHEQAWENSGQRQFFSFYIDGNIKLMTKTLTFRTVVLNHFYSMAHYD